MEINVALDELLGIRGPPSTLIRNLLWLLAFNATYLGLFAFVPRIIGSAVYVGIFNTTSCALVMKAIPYMYSEDGNSTTVYSTITAVNQVSEDLNTTFQLPDIATMILGYFAIAFMTTVMLFAWKYSQMFRRRFSFRNTRRHIMHRQPVPRNANWQDFHMNAQDAAANPQGVAFLDGAVAVVKVGVLLFLKMFALPQILGLALDASTVSLFGQTLADRVYFAGSDIFSFILLHWVAGITFMLLVTVFLLQLREVMHPDILARVIRPQEPHPDLLGNLMNETVATHIKRMVLSLAIYAPILLLHVTLPVQLLLRSGSIFSVPFFHLNFWHAMKPELQIPLELIIFHLSMLALLEKYKNTIGLLQHSWLTLVCGALGLTDYMLARSVEKFELVGTKSIIPVEGGVLPPVDQFWYDLAKQTPNTVEAFVEGKITKHNSTVTHETLGEAKSNGQRVYTRKTKSIRLPGTNDGAEDTLLPTAIGPYRLNVQEHIASTLVVEFWREVRGDTIARPPEGWDDLGAGGAFVQGRWAWGQEKPSVVERGVAIRKYFADPGTQKRPTVLMSKVVLLLVLGWIAVVCAIFSFVSVPLLVGRSLYFLFRVDASYVHDPFAFVMGGCLVFPGMSLLASSIKLHEGNLAGRLVQWARAFRMPPTAKFLVLSSSIVLWCFIAPLALGLSYELCLVKASTWFNGASVLPDLRSFVLSWMAGSAVLNTWAFLAYFSVFTRQFWSNVGNGMLEPPVDENGNPLPPRNHANEIVGSRTDWQGRQGRVAQFFGVWKAAMVDWDWEKVDKTCLLVEFAIPISRQLTSSLVGSMVSFILLLNVVPFLIRTTENGNVALPFLGDIERGFFRQLVFRSCMISHIIVQLCSSFRSRLELWFESAHNSAKDARYLIGEVLMNYNGRP
jgi:E3 ubiquitin-protein ligase MARCH6